MIQCKHFAKRHFSANRIQISSHTTNHGKVKMSVQFVAHVYTIHKQNFHMQICTVALSSRLDYHRRLFVKISFINICYHNKATKTSNLAPHKFPQLMFSQFRENNGNCGKVRRHKLFSARLNDIWTMRMISSFRVL